MSIVTHIDLLKIRRTKIVATLGPASAVIVSHKSTHGLMSVKVNGLKIPLATLVSRCARRHRAFGMGVTA